jgi:hypothetical protein
MINGGQARSIWVILRGIYHAPEAIKEYAAEQRALARLSPDERARLEADKKSERRRGWRAFFRNLLILIVAIPQALGVLILLVDFLADSRASLPSEVIFFVAGCLAVQLLIAIVLSPSWVN